MESFGEKLKRERESRNKTIDQIASSTKIQRGYLEALEHNKFEGLPGSAFGKFYIRAYAEILGFDPAPLIAEYDRERYRRNSPAPPKPPEKRRRKRRPRAWLQTPEPPAPPESSIVPAPPEPTEALEALRPPEPAPTGPAPPEPASGPPEPQPSLDSTPVVAGPRTRPKALWWGSLAALAGAAWILIATRGPEPAPVDVAAPLRGPEETATPSPTPSGESIEIVDEIDIPKREVPEITRPAPPATESRLSVAQFGVGRGVTNRRLEGPTTRFEEGSVAYFSTRVLGGEAGETIQHTWFREGRLVESISLDLGGAHWRTHSRKTLWGIGNWTVEARDAEGRTLATATFACVPAGSL